MAAVPITVPGVGESISEGILARWLKPAGALVKAGEPLFELETDKASNVVPAASTGVLQVNVSEGDTVAIGATIGSIDPEGTAAAATTVVPPAPTSPAPSSPNGGTATAPDLPLSPAVRRLVTENDVNPALVTPTGPGGRITKGDVLTHLETPASAKTAPAKTVPVPPAAATGVIKPPPPASSSRTSPTARLASG